MVREKNCNFGAHTFFFGGGGRFGFFFTSSLRSLSNAVNSVKITLKRGKLGEKALNSVTEPNSVKSHV